MYPFELIKLRDQLVFRDEPSSFKELASLAIRVDNRIRERRKERDSNSLKPLRLCLIFRNLRRTQIPLCLCVSTALVRFYLPPLLQVSRPVSYRSTTNIEATESMQLGQTRLTPEERLRHMPNKEYLYCGSPSCFISSFSVRPNDYADQ